MSRRPSTGAATSREEERSLAAGSDQSAARVNRLADPNEATSIVLRRWPYLYQDRPSTLLAMHLLYGEECYEVFYAHTFGVLLRK